MTEDGASPDVEQAKGGKGKGSKKTARPATAKVQKEEASPDVIEAKGGKGKDSRKTPRPGTAKGQKREDDSNKQNQEENK